VSHRRLGIRVPARDGVKLVADLHLPADERPAPCVVIRTPYGRQGESARTTATVLTDRGYAVVCQDVRGRYDSDGQWQPYLRRQEGRDGYDTIEWAAAQPWCDGRVGTVGSSYGGWAQWATMRERPPHLRTMIVSAAPGLWLEEAPYCRGVLLVAGIRWFALVAGRVSQSLDLIDWERVLMTLPLAEMDLEAGRELPGWRDWIARPIFDERWHDETITDEELAAADLPTLHITGWFDDHRRSTIAYHDRLVASGGTDSRRELLVGPWSHGGCRWPTRLLDGVDFGSEAERDIDQAYAEWFDRHLRRQTHESGERLRLFLTGSRSWREFDGWPDSETLEFYLGSATTARSAGGDGWLVQKPGHRSAADSIVSDPCRPVHSIADWESLSRGDDSHGLDLGHVVERSDVLVYTTEPRDAPLLIIGSPVLELLVGCDAPDADLIALLGDVSPDGRTLRLAHMATRLSLRNSLEERAPLTSDAPVVVELKFGAIAHEVRNGHSLRLAICGSYFPLYARDLQTDEPYIHARESRRATLTVHYRGDPPSWLKVPVVT
jgi:putative CocE/NonD family hydrolase